MPARVQHLLQRTRKGETWPSKPCKPWVNYQSTFHRLILTLGGAPKATYADRLWKAWHRSQAQFMKDYNDRLYNGLSLLMFGAAMVFRFVLHVRFVETIGWAGFCFLQLYPHLSLGTPIYESHWWLITVGLKSMKR